MNYTLFSILLFVLFSSCIGATSENNTRTFDSTIYPFDDTSYQLTVHQFNTATEDQKNNNSTVSFRRLQGKKVQVLFQDSFYCMYPDITLQDFNNDRVKDILVFYYSGGRANPTYHLYIVDTLNYKLAYVNGFENLPNPDFDTTNNVITSVAGAGKNYIWSFYEINSQNKLINLGNGFTADEGDSVNYNRAIKQILREKSK